LVSRSHTPTFDATVCRGLGPHRPIACGSVGVKAARLALGQADLYLHQGRGLKLWDACGPDALVQSAGGRVTDWKGAAIGYRGGIEVGHGLVAGSPAIHGRILPFLAASQAGD
jgi:3'(2'), 5'-bisphosphate nucleotidase